jgi:beta-lactamase superfamily II metal-dependent hydrolase
MTPPATPPRFALEVLRAEHGDCLLVHHGDHLLLIDGGPTGVYKATLKPRLQELMNERGRPLPLKLVMVSHIDDDHIVGLTDMFGEAVERQEERRGAKEWLASELWFNAFKGVTGASDAAVQSGLTGAAVQAVIAAAPGAESEAIAASVPNGVALSDDAAALKIGLNTSAGGGLVETAENAATTVTIAPGLTFTILAPSAQRLSSLRKTWEAWEKAQREKADAKTAANVDRSVFNLSSIVVLARSGERSMLLTGDARSDDILKGLTGAGLLTKDGPPLIVDILKLPHHGSIRNIAPEFFDRVRARHYVISANGRDGNPEDDTLAAIRDADHAGAEPWTLWLTYGGRPGDGKRGLPARMKKFFGTPMPNGKPVDVRFGAPGQAHTIEL